jgi:protein-S-isoprenylcysteine O-methyltransferase Ste14
VAIIPAFELGFWNAWLFMGPVLLEILLCMGLMIKKVSPGGPVRFKCKSRTTLIFASLSKIIIFPAALYSIFLPLKFGTAWFYVGFLITLLGTVGTLLLLFDWALTPTGKPVTRGFYRYSRHPMYVSIILVLLGVSVISASWVFLLFTIIALVGFTRPHFVKLEEDELVEHYGAAYEEYLKRTPRWIGLPKSDKK